MMTVATPNRTRRMEIKLKKTEDTTIRLQTVVAVSFLYAAAAHDAATTTTSS